VGSVHVLSGPPRFRLADIRRVVGAACARVRAERAVLFGSYARGDADAYSDLDLLLVCETELPFLERFRLLADVLHAFPGCELLVYTPVEMAAMAARPGVVAEALREGVVLYRHEAPVGAER